MRCGSWKCDYCRKKLAAKWAIRTYLQAQEWPGHGIFGTLTLWGSVTTPSEGYEMIPRLWDNFRKECQRASGNFQYIAFVEGQAKRNGMPHFHFITPTIVWNGRLKDAAVRAGFGYQAKAEQVQGARAALYVSKYASKADEHVPARFRRVRTSRDWKKLPDPNVQYPALIQYLPHELPEAYIYRCADFFAVSPTLLSMIYHSACC